MKEKFALILNKPEYKLMKHTKKFEVLITSDYEDDIPSKDELSEWIEGEADYHGRTVLITVVEKN